VLVQQRLRQARESPQNLSTLEAGRRATLVAYLLDRAASLTDEALEMHDRMVGEAMAGAKRTRDENLKGRGKQVNEKVGLYAGVGKALIKARESGADPYALLEEFVPWERFVETVAEAEDLAVPEAFDFLEHLKNHHKRLRRYAPLLMETFRFSAAPPSELARGGGSPEGDEPDEEAQGAGRRSHGLREAPVGAARLRRGRLHRQGRLKGCVLSGLKDGLRSGDVYTSTSVARTSTATSRTTCCLGNAGRGCALRATCPWR